MRWRDLLVTINATWWLWLLARLTVYASLFTLLWTGNGGSSQPVIGLTSGIIYADFITWVMWRLFSFTLGAEFALEGGINLTLAIILMKFSTVTLPTDGDGLAIAFFAFMGTATIKIATYMLTIAARAR
ncbi:MAG TPA: hypothetical protein VFR01_00415 [Geobacterales bacterium]|nr:hypothetical protein [Geobacterales bacterium]